MASELYKTSSQNKAQEQFKQYNYILDTSQQNIQQTSFIQQNTSKSGKYQQSFKQTAKDYLSVIKPVINYPECKIEHLLHNGEKSNFICLEPNCEKNNIGCGVCMEEFHNGHFFKPLKVVLQQASCRANKIADNNNELLLKIVQNSEEEMLDQLDKTALNIVLQLKLQIENFHKSIYEQIQSHSKLNIQQMLDNVYIKSYQRSNQQIDESQQDIALKIQSLKIDHDLFQKNINQLLQSTCISKDDFQGDAHYYLQHQNLEKDQQMYAISSTRTTSNIHVGEFAASQKKQQEALNEAASNFQSFIKEIEAHLKKINYNNQITNLLSSHFQYFIEMVKEFNIWGNRDDIIYQYSNNLSYISGLQILDNYRVQSLHLSEKIDRFYINILRNVNNIRYALMEPNLLTNKNREFGFKINKLANGHLVTLGITHLNQARQNEFKRFRHSNIGHGCYMISNNGYVWSNFEILQNCEQLSFKFQEQDLISIKYKPLKKKITFEKHSQNKKKTNQGNSRINNPQEENIKYKMGIEVQENNPLHIAIIFHYEGDEIEFTNKIN